MRSSSYLRKVHTSTSEFLSRMYDKVAIPVIPIVGGILYLFH